MVRNLQILIAGLALTVLLAGCSKEKMLQPTTSQATPTHQLRDDIIDDLAPATTPTPPPAPPTVSQTVSTTTVSDITNNSGFTIIMVPDAMPAIVVVANTIADIQNVVTSVHHGELTVSSVNATSAPASSIKVYVHSPRLSEVSVRGSGPVSFNGAFNRLELNVDNGSNISLSGSANNLRIEGNNGNVDATEMPAINVTVTGRGNGITHVWAQNFLSANIAGNYTLYYMGNPVINQSVRGNAQLIHE